MDKLSNSVIWIGTSVILVSFLISLFIPKNKIAYMRGFYFCPLIALLLSINAIYSLYFPVYFKDMLFTIQNCLFILDLLFWYHFFLKVLNNKKDSEKLEKLLLLTLLFAVYLIFFSTAGTKNLHVIALTAICKTIFCVFFYYKLFKNLYYQNILKEPSFWIITGLIFCSCLSLPFYGLHSYIKSQFSSLISSNIFSVSNMLIIIMHLFFIKAYLRTIQVHKA